MVQISNYTTEHDNKFKPELSKLEFEKESRKIVLFFPVTVKITQFE